ncbi:DUF1758 domain-containing protein [Trichonephila clavipes]|nr:DUF1758 domain-containing protein [Trichonephila clavipes]
MDLNIKFQVQEEESIVTDIDGIQPFNEMISFKDIFPGSALHQAIKKEGRVTSSTRIVFDAASHQANELSLNDCLWPGPNLNPNLLDVLINFRLNRVTISSDNRQAFLQNNPQEKGVQSVPLDRLQNSPILD